MNRNSMVLTILLIQEHENNSEDIKKTEKKFFDRNKGSCS
jgi:hypothetical protein